MEQPGQVPHRHGNHEDERGGALRVLPEERTLCRADQELAGELHERQRQHPRADRRTHAAG